MARVESILGSIGPEDIQDLGFPAVIKPQALSRDYYEALDRAFPPLEKVTGGAPVASNTRHRLVARDCLADPEVPEIWRDFVRYHTSEAFFREFCRMFGDHVRRTHPRFEENFGKPLEEFSVGLRHGGKADDEGNRSHDIVLDVQFGWNSPNTEVSTVRGPHLDSPIKLLTGLLYFRDEDDDSEGADLEFHHLRQGRYPKPKAARIDPDTVEPYLHVPYAANTLVFFINSPLAVHGVTPRSVTDRPRRFMNFVGECYLGRTPDFFIAPETRSPYAWRQLVRAVKRRL
ncbi:MAG: 2OG-Fe(II) oxygenase [Myxococcota bacterium]|nr:2OG-Fe(II) oxygenase [Myxococcota bacterium]